MYMGYLEEGDKCPEEGCDGVMNFTRVDDCSCHISPPCHSCTNAPLMCTDCGFVKEEEAYKYVATGYEGLSIRVGKPRPLDSTKIDWRWEPHSGASMIKRGVYPEGATRADVEKEVRGTFGGRFTSFGDGKFCYVAYTD